VEIQFSKTPRLSVSSFCPIFRDMIYEMNNAGFSKFGKRQINILVSFLEISTRYTVPAMSWKFLYKTLRARSTPVCSFLMAIGCGLFPATKPANGAFFSYICPFKIYSARLEVF